MQMTNYVLHMARRNKGTFRVLHGFRDPSRREYLAYFTIICYFFSMSCILTDNN